MTDEPLPTSAEDTGTTAVDEAAAEKTDDKPEKLTQTVDIRDVGPCKKHIKVTVGREDIDASFQKKFKELVGDSWIPGFRPGKAPRPIVQRKFKKDVHDRAAQVQEGRSRAGFRP